MGGGEAARAHDRPRVRVVHAPVRPRDRLRGRARPRTIHRQHARRRGAGAPGAVRGGGRRRVEAAVRGAPADPRRPRGSRRGDRPHQARPRRRRDARDRSRRGPRTRGRHRAVRRADRSRVVRDRRGRRRARRGAGRDAGRGGAGRGRSHAPAYRSGVHHQGGGHRGDRERLPVDASMSATPSRSTRPASARASARCRRTSTRRIARAPSRASPRTWWASSGNGSGVATSSRCRRRGGPRASSTHDCDPCAV